VTRFLLLPLLLLALVAAPAAAPAAAAPGKPGATKKRCPAGTTPVVRKKGKRAVPKRDRRGRLRCRTVMAGKPPAPAATPVGQAGNVADSLRAVRAISPKSTAKLERVLGRKRARRMLGITTDGWQKAASAARASQDTETTTYEPSEGVRGTLTIGGQDHGGADSGFSVTATATAEATRDGIDGLAPGLKDKLPSDLKSVKGEAKIAFEDKLAACPDGKGERKGAVKATGKIKVTVERDGKPPVVVEQSVAVEMTYTSRSGDGTIDVVSTTEFSSGGSGVPTQTYRGRRVGAGFGRDSIIDGGKDHVERNVERDYAHFSDEAGGVWGPRGGWNFARGIHVTDLRSFQNVEAMVTTLIHTDLLTLAALEYARKQAIPRAEKEECGYSVALTVNGTGIFATHDATGQIAVTVPATEVGEGAWHAQAPAPWTNLVFTTKHECGYIDPVSSGTFMADLALTPDGMLDVVWHVDLGIATASVDCPPDGDVDPPPISGQAGPGLVGVAPMRFQLPAAGGSQAISGGVQDGGEGFFNDGVLTVTRVR
jgi:hypothetical protein